MLNTGKLSARLEKKINSCLVGKGAGGVHIHVPLCPDMIAPLVDGDPANGSMTSDTYTRICYGPRKMLLYKELEIAG